jgi:hypothetical protein
MEALMSGLLCVEESEKTKKARDKLKKILEKLEKEITQDGLNKKIFEIHDRISRLAPERVVLKRKSISLFDNNQNAAKVSEKVASIFQALRLNKISPGSADDDI